MEKETNIQKCKDCANLKKRILVGKFNSKDKKYIDEDNLTWNGHRCGSCHRKKQAMLGRIKYHSNR